MLSTLNSLKMVKTINNKNLILNEKRRSNYQKNKRRKIERAKKELEEIQIQEYTQTKN
jgi:mevalonate pyrophosphate decarboxylase